MLAEHTFYPDGSDFLIGKKHSINQHVYIIHGIWIQLDSIEKKMKQGKRIENLSGEGIPVLDRVVRVSLRRQHWDTDLMGTREMALGLPREMCFRKGEKQQEGLHAEAADTFEEQQ